MPSEDQWVVFRKWAGAISKVYIETEEAVRLDEFPVESVEFYVVRIAVCHIVCENEDPKSVARDGKQGQ